MSVNLYATIKSETPAGEQISMSGQAYKSVITGFLFVVAVVAHAEAMTWPFYQTSLTFLPEEAHPGPVPGFTPNLVVII